MILYIAKNKIVALFVFYFLFSLVLKVVADIDICIPCLWKSIFGFECPGCGLTIAFICLIELEIKKAFETNCLIFFLFPIGIYFIRQDYLEFTREYQICR